MSHFLQGAGLPQNVRCTLATFSAGVEVWANASPTGVARKAIAKLAIVNALPTRVTCPIGITTSLCFDSDFDMPRPKAKWWWAVVARVKRLVRDVVPAGC
jgi:hypothetical protein